MSLLYVLIIVQDGFFHVDINVVSNDICIEVVVHDVKVEGPARYKNGFNAALTKIPKLVS
jgi:hypothetical protein